MRRGSGFAIGIGLLAAAALLDASPALAAWPSSPYADVPICTAVGAQLQLDSAPDGDGGAYIVWTDLRTGHYDVYAMRVLADGTRAPGWPVDGRPIAAGAGEQWQPAICTDGAGGAYISWSDSSSASDYDVRVIRIDENGDPKPGWSASGLNVSNNGRAELESRLSYDGAGGVFVAWELVITAGTNHDIRALRVRGDGALIAPYVPGGLFVCTSAAHQRNIDLLDDGAAGVFIVWEDQRTVIPFGWDLYGAHITAAGALDWTANGAPVVTGAGNQTSQALVTDGAGGLLVFWEDNRTGDEEIYGGRLGPTGTRLWVPERLISTAPSGQFDPIAVADGGGGAYVAWTRNIGGGNSDIYAQHVRPNGSVMWATNGAGVCTQSASQFLSALSPDGEGGVVALWWDERNGVDADLYAQRIGPAESSGLWAFDGVPVAVVPGYTAESQLVPDGRGGFIASWIAYDGSVGSADIRARRFDRFGFLGDPVPVVVSVADVPNDQGGQVKVSWDASPLDVAPYFDLAEYRMWRSVPPQSALALLRSGAAVLDDEGAARAPGVRRLARDAGLRGTTYWEHVGTQVAAGDPGYSMVVATESDSIGGSNPLTLFRVQARHEGGWAFWNSEEASGYSVDNLAPPAPAPFAAVYGGGSTALHWGVVTAPDLRGYRIYAGTAPNFAPGPGSFVVEVPDTGYVDAALSPLHYKLTAVDDHGNESPAVLVSPPGNVGVGPVAGSFHLAPPSPNPFRDQVSIQWTLPEASHVRLVVFDAAGRAVALLVNDRLDSGSHTVRWDGRAGTAGMAPPGLYFARLEAGPRTAVRRLLRID